MVVEELIRRAPDAFPGVDRVGYTGGSGPQTFGKTPAIALSADRAYIGTADAFEIEVYSLEGELLRRIRRQYEVMPVTDDDVERYIDAQTADLAPERARERAIWIRDQPMPGSFPAYERFLLDAEGNLWVEIYQPPGRERRSWSVFDGGGVWLGDVDVPPTFEATDIGADGTLGVFRNELDEQSVRQYRIER